MQFAAQQIHRNLARHNDMFVAFAAANFLAVDLKMTRRLVYDLLGCTVLRATLANIAELSFGGCGVGCYATHFGIGE